MLSASTLIACLAASAGSAAQPAPLRLDYEVAAGCPGAGAFTSEVHARAPRSARQEFEAMSVRVQARRASGGRRP